MNVKGIRPTAVDSAPAARVMRQQWRCRRPCQWRPRAGHCCRHGLTLFIIGRTCPGHRPVPHQLWDVCNGRVRDAGSGGRYRRGVLPSGASGEPVLDDMRTVRLRVYCRVYPIVQTVPLHLNSYERNSLQQSGFAPKSV